MNTLKETTKNTKLFWIDDYFSTLSMSQKGKINIVEYRICKRIR